MNTKCFHFTKILKIFRWGRRPALWVPLALLLLGQAALAQEEPFTIDGKEVEQYLADKYHVNLRAHDVYSTLQQTPNGPQGTLDFRGGEITPKNVVITGETAQDRARAIAQAFLTEEVELFGITNMEEIREARIETDKGGGGDYTYIRYGRYINNLKVEGVDIRITIGPNETIRHGMAKLVAVPPELYEAVQRPTLTEAEIRKIVMADREADAASPETNPIAKAMIIRDDPHDPDPEKMELRKHLMSSPPYVVWSVKDVWAYTIDAFTGEILKKTPTWILN